MRRRIPLAVVACATLLSGCSLTQIRNQVVGDRSCKPGPVVYLIVDTSLSTGRERGPGGPYHQAALKVVRETARECGVLFAAPADGNAIADSRWTIDGRTFRAAIAGSRALNERARAQQAEHKLAGKVHALLGARTVDGSDILGALDRVALSANAEYPDRRKLVVVLTDGALLVKGQYNVYRDGVATAAQRSRFVGKLRREDEIPDLRGIAGVYIGGLALDVTGRNTARGIIRLWQQLVPMMHSQLRKPDSTLHFP